MSRGIGTRYSYIQMWHRSTPAFSGGALTAHIVRVNNPGGMFGWACWFSRCRQFTHGVKQLFELIARIAAQLLFASAKPSVFCSSSASRLARSACKLACSRLRTNARRTKIAGKVKGPSPLQVTKPLTSKYGYPWRYRGTKYGSFCLYAGE